MKEPPICQLPYRALLATLLCALLLTTGCATQPYDYSALLKSKPRSIVVIPPLNNTVEVGAEYTFLATISKPLAEKGYYLFPVTVVDQLLRENGLPTTAEMNNIPLDKIRDVIGADAVLYVSLEDWGQKYQVITSKSIVHAKLKLVDARTGAELWSATAYAEQGSSDGGGGIAGALVGALVEQVAGSIIDRTHDLSVLANDNAINNLHHGLLNGPYRPTQQEKP